MGLWDRAVRRINQTPLAQGIEQFGERQVKPLLRGLDADNATHHEIEGLAWTPNNLRGQSLRRASDEEFDSSLDPDRQFASQEEAQAFKGLHRRTVPRGGRAKQAPVFNDEPNLLGRLLISDVKDEAATRLLNDRNFAASLGTTPDELLATRQQINDAAQMGMAIQQEQPRNFVVQQQPETSGQDIGNLLQSARQTPNNQNIARVLDSIRNPTITYFDALPERRAKKVSTLRNQPQPETYEQYAKQTIDALDARLQKLKDRGLNTTQAADLAFRDDDRLVKAPLLTRQQFEERKASGEPFDTTLISEVFERSPDAIDPDNSGYRREFLSDFLTRKLGISPDTMELAAASSNPELKVKAEGAHRVAVDNIAAAEAYGDTSYDTYIEQGKALGQMRDAVIRAEELGLNATDILKADELGRAQQGLIRMKGRSVDKTKMGTPDQRLEAIKDKRVQKAVKDLIELEDLELLDPSDDLNRQHNRQTRDYIDNRIKELNAQLSAEDPKVLEAGLRFIAEQGTAQQPKGGGRKRAAKVLGSTDRAGLNTPFLSQAGQDTYRFFINPNNPLNLGTPTLLAGSAALAGAGALLVDAANETELEQYDSSMAQGYANEVLRKADPEAVAYAIANSSLY